MAYRDKKGSLIKSFGYALEGITHTIKKERNIKVQLVVAILVVGISLLLSLSPIEWAIICLTIFGVLALELMNTALEKVVDLVTEEYHPLAKLAKDIAAGSVFLFTIGAVIIGLIIFLPKVIIIISEIL